MALAEPSQFGRLLRRSKFAKYDPCIAQVFTSHSGYAHRGDFGLKRPLPRLARTSRPSVTVKAVDTRQQQTEWALTHPQSKFIRRWEETGATADSDFNPHTTWSLNGQVVRRWEVDSEFDQTEGKIPSPPMVTNYHAMTKAQFDEYLNHLRSLRPQFKQFLDAKRSEVGQNQSLNDPLSHFQRSPLPPLPVPLSMTTLARKQSALHAEFLKQLASDSLSNPSSTTLTPKPHPNAALSYHRSNPLQQWLLHPPAPGRLLLDDPERSGKSRGNFVSRKVAFSGVYANISGVAREEPMPFGSSSTHADGDRDTEPALDTQALSKGIQDLSAGLFKFRVRSASVSHAPKVVGHRPSLQGAAVSITVVQAQDVTSSRRMIPYRPGSVEYSAYEMPQVGDAARSLTQFSRAPGAGRKKQIRDETAAEDLNRGLNSVLGLIQTTVPKP